VLLEIYVPSIFPFLDFVISCFTVRGPRRISVRLCSDTDEAVLHLTFLHLTFLHLHLSQFLTILYGFGVVLYCKCITSGNMSLSDSSISKTT